MYAFQYIFCLSYFYGSYWLVTRKFFSLKSNAGSLLIAAYIVYSANPYLLAFQQPQSYLTEYIVINIIYSLLVVRVAYLFLCVLPHCRYASIVRGTSTDLFYFMFLALISVLYSISNVHYLFAFPFAYIIYKGRCSQNLSLSGSVLLIASAYLISSWICQGGSITLLSGGSPAGWMLLNLARVAPYLVSFFIIYYHYKGDKKIASFIPKNVPFRSVFPHLILSFIFVYMILSASVFSDALNNGLGNYLDSFDDISLPFVLVLTKITQRSDILLYSDSLYPSFGIIINDRISYLLSSVLSPIVSLLAKLNLLANYEGYDLAKELSNTLRGFGVFNISMPSFIFYLLNNYAEFLIACLIGVGILILSFSCSCKRLFYSFHANPIFYALGLFYLLTVFSSLYDYRVLEIYVLMICLTFLWEFSFGRLSKN